MGFYTSSFISFKYVDKFYVEAKSVGNIPGLDSEGETIMGFGEIGSSVSINLTRDQFKKLYHVVVQRGEELEID